VAHDLARRARTFFGAAAGASLISLACGRALPASAGGRDGGGEGTILDGATEPATDARADLSAPDLAPDPAPICPAGVAPVDVCGCGCCGSPQSVTCYYPAQGESAEAIPNPMPSPASCANVGCSGGVRHLCCVDPGPGPAADTCAEDLPIEDLARHAVVRRDGAVCTTLEIDLGVPAELPIAGGSGWTATFGQRGPCDGSSPVERAIGGAGTLSVHPLATGSAAQVVDIHAALFFEDGTGTATAVRLDADGLVVQSPRCYGTP
jgi:hypothetical protein